MLETLHIVSNFLGVWDKKNKSFIQKTFFRVVINAIRASTGKFCGKSILLPEKLCFLLEIWICSNFFCPVANKLSRWAKTAMHVFRGNICGNFALKNYFFSNVRTLSRETWTFYGKNMARLSKLLHKCPSEKISGKMFLHSWFVINFERWPGRIWKLPEKNWAGMSKLISMCPEEHLQSNVSDRNCSKFQGFRLNYEVSGTLTNIFLQGCENRKKIPEEHIKESPFSKRKNLLNF